MKKLNRLRTANDQLLKNIHGTDYTYTETVIQYLRGALSVSYTHLTLPTKRIV